MPRLLALIACLACLSGPAVLEFPGFLDCPHVLNNAVPQREWWQHAGHLWFQLFRRLRVSQTGTVIEIAPGSSTKVGLGLREYGFHGTLILVEPHAKALADVTAAYRELMPNVKIVGVALPLDRALADLPKFPDAVVANHPLDDMILGRALDSANFARFFEGIYDRNNDGAGADRWIALGRRPDELVRFTELAVDDWRQTVAKLRPRVVAISQYPSQYYALHGTVLADQTADLALQKLKDSFPDAAWAHGFLPSVGQNPRYWLIHERTRSLEQELVRTPEAILRQDFALFLPAPARQLGPDEIELIYVSRRILEGHGFVLPPPAQTNALLTRHLALDLQPPDGAQTFGEPVQTVWVDRQADPMGIALNGNGGSGRANYVGAPFNAKGGGRTPVAFQSETDVHGTGRLAFGSALWEIVTSNSAAEALRTGASEVPAAFRYKKKKFPAPWGDHPPVTAATIVRFDEGALDRPSHLFHTPRPTNLLAMASQFGEQDGEKFIERVVHGAWSAANISVRAHLLDMDTVSAVAGRGPRYSLTGWFPGNFFGLEGIGHKSLLRALSANAQINTAASTPAALEQAFDTGRRETIERRLLDLWGIDPVVQHKARYHLATELRHLADEFLWLSTRIRPDLSILYTAAPASPPAELFDLSRLFRYAGKIADKDWIAVAPDLTLKKHEKVSPASEAHLRANYTVQNEGDFAAAKKRAEKFKADYLAFHEKAFHLGLTWAPQEVAQRAYVANETRNYLSDHYGAAVVHAIGEAYEKGEIDGPRLQALLDWLIDANFRRGPETDKRLFKEGYFVRRWAGVRQTFTVGIWGKGSGGFQLEVNGQVVTHWLQQSGDTTLISSLPTEMDLNSVRLALIRNGVRLAFTEWTPRPPLAPFALVAAP